MSLLLPETMSQIKDAIDEIRGGLSAQDIARLQRHAQLGVEYFQQEVSALAIEDRERAQEGRAREASSVKLILWSVAKERENLATEAFWAVTADVVTRGLIALV